MFGYRKAPKRRVGIMLYFAVLLQKLCIVPWRRENLHFVPHELTHTLPNTKSWNIHWQTVCPMQLFSFLITWHSSSSKSAAVYKISSKSDDFSLRYGDITIFKMAAVRHLGIVYRHTRPPTKSLLLTAAACQILCQCDTQIWICSYSNFSHIWLEMPILAPKWGFWGTLDL